MIAAGMSNDAIFVWIILPLLGLWSAVEVWNFMHREDK